MTNSEHDGVLGSQLDEHGRADRDALDAARTAVTEADRDASRRRLMAAMGGIDDDRDGDRRDPRNGPSNGRGFVWVAIAALVVAVLWLGVQQIFGGDERDPRDDTQMHGDGDLVLIPDGSVAAFRRVAVEGLSSEPGARYSIRVFSPPDSILPKLKSPELNAPVWSPSAADLARLGTELRWELHVVGQPASEPLHEAAAELVR